MGSRGRLPRRPQLSLVTGNPGHVAADVLEARSGLQLPPSAPPEPDWSQLFPPARRAPKGETKEAETKEAKAKRLARSTAAARSRRVAGSTWRLVVPPLDAAGMLAKVDLVVLEELCVCRARVDECERIISRDGISDDEGRRHGLTIAVGKYRERLSQLTKELGLSPTARLRMSGTPAGAGASPEVADGTYDV